MKKAPPVRLEKWQRNSIFETIPAAGLKPIDFDLADGDNDQPEFRLKHRKSGSCFIVGGDAVCWALSVVVGDTSPVSLEIFSWSSLLRRISRWLDDVKREINTPDLWAELRRDDGLLGVASYDNSDNMPFTLGEQKEIAERLQGLAERMSQHYSLSMQQTQQLNALLDYAMNAAQHLGRIDWRNVLVGAIMGWIVSTAVLPEYGREIFMDFWQSVGHLLNHLNAPMH